MTHLREWCIPVRWRRWATCQRLIDETTEPKPVDIYGINKRTVEDYCQLYHRLKGVPTTVVRPANLYGPRAPLYDTGYGLINQFVGNASSAMSP
ncbi:NAD-dependent epimerase/dehydratase family protein (plasmid) [Haloarcula sp. NS06]|uniref:NAD-dependent epimerase/dehydratase family protein n=1 Tax=Haloarcula sp. NS06 TaxID=3409688 RepID=UPI003DA781FF